VAISGIYWELVTLIGISFWLIDTTRQFMVRNTHVIALDAFAQANFFSPMIRSPLASRYPPSGGGSLFR
jgi:hypothetical protein